MRTKFMITTLVLTLALAMAVTAAAQEPREDAIWARTSLAPITLDGVLDEPGWALADSHIIEYGVDAGVPGSGWKTEAGWQPVDPTHATIKFLVHGNQLYMAAIVQDQSVGGSSEFNRFDGLLMGMKDHSVEGYPKPQAEYLYSWWNEEMTDPQAEGTLPTFIGMWAELPHGAPRTPEQIAAWDAVTVVDGVTNNDDTPDGGYVVEMRFDLEVMGYDVTQPGGDIVEWNLSVYDCDWYWPISVTSFSTNRVWWQGPWGNTSWYSEVRIHARPDVTTASGPAPQIAPEMVVPYVDEDATIDGALTEDAWSSSDIYSFDIRWGDDALRESYEGIGPYRAGQYQATVNGGEAFVLDPADATVKVYHRDNMLYFGFEARDQVVQYHPDLNRWDGFIVTLEDRANRGTDNTLLTKRFSFQVNEDGTALPQDDLLNFVATGDAQVAVSLMTGTSVDTLGQQSDPGYTAEIAVDLGALGYDDWRSDRALFFGVVHLDGDSFLPTTDSYGTRVWWYREFPGTCCPVWAYLEPGTSGIGESPDQEDAYARLLGSPASSRPQVSFAMPEANLVSLKVYDLRGHELEARSLGEMGAGTSRIPLFSGRLPASGVYLYRLQLLNPVTGQERAVLNGKTVLVK